MAKTSDALKETLKEILRGMAEGGGKQAVEAGAKKARPLTKEAATSIKTHFGGLGPGDEALFNNAFNGLTDDNDSKRIIAFINSLSESERDWFHRVIAEQEKDTGKGTKTLKNLAKFQEPDKIREAAKSRGLIKHGPLERERDTIAEKIQNRISDRNSMQNPRPKRGKFKFLPDFFPFNLI